MRGGAAEQTRRCRVAAGCGRRVRRVRRVDRAEAAFAPARTHRATTRSATRGCGRMGTHGRRRKVQRAGAEVCAQGEGVLACLLRWPIRRRDGRLGRHQQGRVRLDEQRGERELRPGRGSRRGSVSAVGLRFAVPVHTRRRNDLRAVVGGERAGRGRCAHADRPTLTTALAASDAIRRKWWPGRRAPGGHGVAAGVGAAGVSGHGACGQEGRARAGAPCILGRTR